MHSHVSVEHNGMIYIWTYRWCMRPFCRYSYYPFLVGRDSYPSPR
jgi:hypothetical protein